MRKLAALVSLAFAAIAANAHGTGLVDGDPESGSELSQQCASCHGPDGNSPSPQWPKLAGQHASYLLAQLKAYASGKRSNAVMNGMVQSLSEQDMADLAAYFSEQDARIGSADEDLAELGERIYRAGNAKSGVPACSGCHGPDGRGNGPAGYPRLSGQHADYTVKQLEAYRAGERSGARAEIMRGVAAGLDDKEIEAVASYIEGLH